MKKPSIQKEHDKRTEAVTEPAVKSGEEEDRSSAIAYRYRLQFYGLDNNGADDRLVAQVSSAIRNEIVRMKGQDQILVTAAPDKAGLVLTGSIEKLDRQYLLSIRLTERRTRRIIYAASEESSTGEGLTGIGIRFAQSIAGNIQ